MTIQSKISLIKDAFNHHLSGEATDLFIAAIQHVKENENFPSVADLCDRLNLPAGKRSAVWDHIEELDSRELVDCWDPVSREMTDIISFPSGVVSIATVTDWEMEIPLQPYTYSYAFEFCLTESGKTSAIRRETHQQLSLFEFCRPGGGESPAIGRETHHQHILDAIANLLRPIFEEQCITEFFAVYKYYLINGRWPTVWELCDSLNVRANDAHSLFCNIDLLVAVGLLYVTNQFGRSKWYDKVSYCDDVELLVTGIIANSRTAAKAGVGC